MMIIKPSIYLILSLLFLTLGTAQLFGDITRVDRVNGVDVTYDYERNYLGAYPVYSKVIRSVFECNVTGVDGRGDNITDCGMVNRMQMEITSYSNVYERGRLKRVQVKGRSIDLHDEGCYSCGTYLLCIDKNDGYSEERSDRFKCVLRSGETGRMIPI